MLHTARLPESQAAAELTGVLLLLPSWAGLSSTSWSKRVQSQVSPTGALGSPGGLSLTSQENHQPLPWGHRGSSPRGRGPRGPEVPLCPACCPRCVPAALRNEKRTRPPEASEACRGCSLKGAPVQHRCGQFPWHWAQHCSPVWRRRKQLAPGSGGDGAFHFTPLRKCFQESQKDTF